MSSIWEQVAAEHADAIHRLERELAAEKKEVDQFKTWLRMNVFAVKVRDIDGLESEIVAEQDGTGAGDIVDAIYTAIDAAKE